MKKEKHLQYFKVENFKGLDSLELSNIGQFNLIVGDNNVGKTSILEALLFNEDLSKLNSRYFHAFIERNDINSIQNEFDFFSFYFNKQKKSDHIKYTLKNMNGEESCYTLKSSFTDKLTSIQIEKIKNELMLNKNNYKYVSILDKNGEEFSIEIIFKNFDNLAYSPMVFYNSGYNKDLINIYSEKVQVSKEAKTQFLSSLELFIPTIEDIEIVPSEIKNYSLLCVRLKDIDELIPLSMFGEGANKLVRILLEILMVKGERLMIDELDTGIHFSRFKSFFKIILKATIANDVQLFTTTHNLECLKYFKDALEENEMKQYQKDAKHFLIERVANNELKAFSYNFEQFENAIDLGNEIRGGN